jgi:hypothetical protein
MTIHAFGYSGRSLDEVVTGVIAADATLVGLGFSPRSRIPIPSSGPSVITHAAVSELQENAVAQRNSPPPIGLVRRNGATCEPDVSRP